MSAAGKLNGCRVLVVEDEAMIAALIESILIDAGCAVVGPIPTLSRALETIDNKELDLAVLDVSVNGRDAYPLADRLSEHGVPVVFVSGFSRQDMPSNRRCHAHLTKPFDPNTMIAVLAGVVARSRAGRAAEESDRVA